MFPVRFHLQLWTLKILWGLIHFISDLLFSESVNNISNGLSTSENCQQHKPIIGFMWLTCNQTEDILQLWIWLILDLFFLVLEKIGPKFLLLRIWHFHFEVLRFLQLFSFTDFEINFILGGWNIQISRRAISRNSPVQVTLHSFEQNLVVNAL